MKILVLAPQWPDPPRQGAAIRNLHILLHLTQRHEVTLLTFAPEGGKVNRRRLSGLQRSEILQPPARSSLTRLRTLSTSRKPDMAWRLRSTEMWQRVRELSEQERFDAVHVEGIEMAPYGLLALESGAASMTYDAHNAEHLLQRRAFTTDAIHPTRLPKALYSLIQWWRLRKFEREACVRSEHIVAVSDGDAAALARLAPSAASRITVLPNGVDTDYWSLSANYPPADMDIPAGSLVFDGTMDFRPNVDAVHWFATHVWPLLRAERPRTQLFIVGRSPTPAVLALKEYGGVTVTGAVPDTRAWVASATVYIVPMRMGGGVRLKVLQAMSMERAIVSTPMGAEGIDIEGGRDMLLARSPGAFSRAVLGLLGDPSHRASLGRSARALVTERYAWPILLPTLDKIYP